MANDFKELNEKIGKNIAKHRKAAKISQLKLSLMTESGEDYISHVECGRSLPSIKLAYKISKALKIELYELFK